MGLIQIVVISRLRVDLDPLGAPFERGIPFILPSDRTSKAPQGGGHPFFHYQKLCANLLGGGAPDVPPLYEPHECTPFPSSREAKHFVILL